jgi:Cellulose binding domain
VARARARVGDDATGTGGTGGAGGATNLPTGVHVQYRCTECTSSSYSVGLHFGVKNMQPAPVVLSAFSIRYWFTAAPLPASALKVHCETIQPSNLLPCTDLVLKIVPVDPPRTGADSYIEMSFTAGSPQIGWMGAIPQLDVRFETSTQPGLTQSDDYSFDPTITALADSMKVTAYADGNLVWGVEP